MDNGKIYFKQLNEMTWQSEWTAKKKDCHLFANYATARSFANFLCGPWGQCEAFYIPSKDKHGIMRVEPNNEIK